MKAPRVRADGFRISLSAWLTGWIVGWTARKLFGLLGSPVFLLASVAGFAVWRLFELSGSWTVPAIAGVMTAGLLVAWARLHRVSFLRWVWWPVKAWWRHRTVYRREWAEVMHNLSLTKKRDGDDLVPALLRVRSTSTVDRVRLRMLPGQTLADFAQLADRFASTFEALDCRVRSTGRKRVLELWFLLRDPLAASVPLFEVPDKPNLKGLPVALREDGLTWNLRLHDSHLLVVGATGAGKGSVLWSIVRALGNGIRTGEVELWVLDPKGGMEFAAGQPLFARYCYGDQPADPAPITEARSKRGEDKKQAAFETAYAVFLEEAVAVMRERQARLRGRFRSHKPAAGDPHIVILVDELASLTAYVTDREAKRRIDAALALLLSQGRAVGITVVGALQDARKETIGLRGLFPTRMALRLNEPDDVDMVLGNGARDRGARCDEIPLDQPGTVFVTVETNPEPVRARFAYVSDDEITTMRGLYAPDHTRRLHAVPDRVSSSSRRDEAGSLGEAA